MDEYKDSWEYEWPPKQVEIVPESSDPKALKKLLKFAINNKDLDKLTTILCQFNPLKVLGIADFEIRHSNVLAWLIDPAGHHGLGDLLFKNILLEVLQDNKFDESPQLKEVLDASYADLKILREWKNIDLLAVSQSNKMVLVVENKIYASEEETQLVRYEAIVSSKYRNYKKVFVFLTLDGTKPKGSDRFIPFMYERIYVIVKSVVENRRSYINSDVYTFICHYLRILEEKVMPNDEFIEICSKLYSEHKDAIAMILTHGKPKLSIDKMQEFHNRTNTQVSSVMATRNIKRFYYFVPCAWSSIVPKASVKYNNYLVCLQFDLSEYENHKIPLLLYVNNFVDSKERERFIDMIDEAAKVVIDIKLPLKKSSKTFTTLYDKTILLKNESNKEIDLSDYDSIIDKLVEAYNDNELQKVLAVADGIVKKFWREGEEKQEVTI